MFVHLGGEAVVDIREVIAVLNVQRIAKSESVRDLLERAKRTKPDVTNPRTVVVSTKGVYLSTVSVETVARRIRRMAQPWRERMAKKQSGQGFPPLTLDQKQ